MIGKLNINSMNVNIESDELEENDREQQKVIYELRTLFNEFNNQIEIEGMKIMDNVVILPERFAKKRDASIGKYGISKGAMVNFNDDFKKKVEQSIAKVKINDFFDM